MEGSTNDAVLCNPHPKIELAVEENEAPDLEHLNITRETSDDHTSPGEMLPTSGMDEHPDGDAIRRQVEFYFSDENLPNDAHLLGLCGAEQNLPVSVEKICGWSKMRKFKPKNLVKASLAKSDFLEFTDNKNVRRKVPLSIKPTVTPEIIAPKVTSDKPWVTKGMLKPTGFEPSFTDAPITPEEFKIEEGLYHSSLSFETRIETAIQRYMARRKLHQTPRAIINKFLEFGGIDCGPKAFGGGISKEELGEKDAAEIAAMMATHIIRPDVLDEAKWKVDFEGLARGFLSSWMVNFFSCDANIGPITNVLNNFYRYLLHHNVCPEYSDQIRAARKICDLTEKELPMVAEVARRLPDSFSSACSTLYNGNFAGVFGADHTWKGADKIGWSKEDAKAVLMSGIANYGTQEQFDAARDTTGDATAFKTVEEQDLCLEVASIEMPDNEAMAFLEAGRLKNTFLKNLGKLHCRYWTKGSSLVSRASATNMTSHFSGQCIAFWVEVDVLEWCFVGMKIEANVRELGVGVRWLDSVKSVNGSFYTLLNNEFYEKGQDDLPYKWYKRQRKIKEGPWDVSAGAEVDDGAAIDSVEADTLDGDVDVA